MAKLPSRFEQIPYYALAPLPTALYQPVLRLIVQRIAAQHPRLFDRLGPHKTKSFLIRPTNLPFVLVLQPNPDKPQLTAHRTDKGLHWDASVTGSFLNLLHMLDGSGDSDAVFFARTIRIEGDTEAIVSLRNALDDVEGSIADDVAALFGPFGTFGLSLLTRFEVFAHAHPRPSPQSTGTDLPRRNARLAAHGG